MRTRFLLLIFASGIVSDIMGQNTIDLTFTAVHNAAYIRLDSIKLMNRTQGDSVKLYWPDTILNYQITSGDLLLFVGYAMDNPGGIGSISKKEKNFRMFQSVPNPVKDHSLLSLYLPAKGAVSMIVSNVRGRIAVKVDRELGEGTHSFRFCPGNERIYFITTRWNGIIQSIKILTEGRIDSKTCKLEYIGPDYEKSSVKIPVHIAGLEVKESGLLDNPNTNKTYTFQFATNIPCPGTPTITYEGQVYNTIQILSQCWLKENLNVGTMVPDYQNQLSNGTIEKYCYNNAPDSCTKYGGLYQWDEVMQYSYQHGAQGICPTGWHLPTDEEWKVLEGAVDSQYEIGDTEWDLYAESRGYDAGTKLKTTSGWYNGGNGTDLFGFSGLPGGSRDLFGGFSGVGLGGIWCTSTARSSDNSWGRQFANINPGVYRNGGFTVFGSSARCLRD